MTRDKTLSDSAISVFGATGFIGSHYTKKSKFNVVPIARNEVCSKSREVLYLIGKVDNYNVFDDINQGIDTNLKKLFDSLEASRALYPNLVWNFVSTWLVYGTGQIPFKESQPCNPKSFYSITKYAAELMLRTFCETYSINYRIIRLGNVVGPGDGKVSERKNAIQLMANKIIKGETVNLYEGGIALRDLIHVDDVVLGLDLIIERGAINEVFNLASGVGVDIRELFQKLKAVTASTSILKHTNTPKHHNGVQSQDSVLDISKVRQLGFAIKRPISERDFLV